ncbi:hypothetical protein GN244_ATG05559 [Phytophthora infestans]|uniref:Uncharacterized protein n=1 Tax=Phytophthora infestans TaxID=4787 RepID=A0A833S7D1_PHYIN|nr:hypothetical protein GN244_ATG05559 [Phytophthora infestans]KAF4137936.1 hypothetical protein GN958_ATG12889 [Phytophthora infestans]
MFKVGGNLGLRLDIAQQRRELGEAVHLEVRERPLEFVVNEVEELQIGLSPRMNLPATIFSSATKYLGTISSTNTFFLLGLLGFIRRLKHEIHDGAIEVFQRAREHVNLQSLGRITRIQASDLGSVASDSHALAVNHAVQL